MSRWALALAAVLLLACPASAQPPVAGYSTVDAARKRGSPRPQAPMAPATPNRPRDSALMSPTLLFPPAPRVTGWTGPEAGGGGAQCRTTCANDRYRCSALDGGDCAAAWTKCVAACPEASSGAL